MVNKFKFKKDYTPTSQLEYIFVSTSSNEESLFRKRDSIYGKLREKKLYTLDQNCPNMKNFLEFLKHIFDFRDIQNNSYFYNLIVGKDINHDEIDKSLENQLVPKYFDQDKYNLQKVEKFPKYIYSAQTLTRFDNTLATIEEKLLNYILEKNGFIKNGNKYTYTKDDYIKFKTDYHKKILKIKRDIIKTKDKTKLADLEKKKKEYMNIREYKKDIRCKLDDNKQLESIYVSHKLLIDEFINLILHTKNINDLNYKPLQKKPYLKLNECFEIKNDSIEKNRDSNDIYKLYLKNKYKWDNNKKKDVLIDVKTFFYLNYFSFYHNVTLKDAETLIKPPWYKVLNYRLVNNIHETTHNIDMLSKLNNNLYLRLDETDKKLRNLENTSLKKFDTVNSNVNPFTIFKNTLKQIKEYNKREYFGSISLDTLTKFCLVIFILILLIFGVINFFFINKYKSQLNIVPLHYTFGVIFSPIYFLVTQMFPGVANIKK